MTRPSRTGGKISAAKARNASAAKGRKPTKTKRRIASAATRAKRRPVSGPSEDLMEAREQQAATAEILKVIASSPDDVQPVLEAVAERTMSLLDAWSVLVTRFDGELLHFGAARGALPDTEQFLRNQYPTRPEAAVFAGRCILERSAINISDAQADPSPQNRERARLRGFRAALSVPMLHNGKPIGVITVSRSEAGAFAANEVELLQTFADQAVIAIQNVRMFEQVQARTAEVTDALQQQTATADVLKAISRSTFDLQSVLDTLISSAVTLCGAVNGTICLRERDGYRFRASFGIEGDWAKFLDEHPPTPGRSSLTGRVLLSGRVESVPDVLEDPDYIMPLAAMNKTRSALGVPLLRHEKVEGVLLLARAEPGLFTQRQIELVQTFADQAVIAIENVRLFDEVQARTRELSEALTYQTASSNILGVIASSPTEVDPALHAIVESACKLCGAYDGTVLLKMGNDLHISAHHGPIRTGQSARPINRDWVVGRSVVDKAPVQVSDFWSPEAAKFPEGQRQSREQGHRCTLSVPLLREGEALGAIALRRLEPVAFSDKQVALLQTFADQAVIAIGNVRLFEEVQARTQELSESLEQQTAATEVLSVISRLAGELEPVFDKMLENATRVCGANFGTMNLVEDGVITRVASYNVPSAYVDASDTRSFRPHPKSSLGQVIANKEAHQILDLLDSPAYLDGDPAVTSIVRNAGARSLVSVPMLRETELIGTISVYGQEVRPFSDKQVELLSNFAKQAVIAIENTRLLKELRESLQQQTATADVLKIISRSSVDLETVLDTLVETVARLCRADQAAMFRRRDDKYHLVAAHGLSAEAKKFMITHPFAPDRGTTSGRVVLERRAVHIPDVLQDSEYTYLEGQKVVGYRTLLGIPLLREETLIGTISVYRQVVRPFTDKEIELANSFADQAVIAIENARLFEELRERQAELRVTFDNMGDGVVMFDAAARLTAWNRNFQEMLDLPDAFLAQRPSYAEYFRYLADRGEYSTDLEAQLSRTIEDTSREMRFERVRPDGRVIEARRNPVPGGGFVLIYSDITERKHAEEAIRTARDAAEAALRDLQTAQDRLIQTEKLASLGQLTAGIAHEIKNPLNFVNNFSALTVELTEELNDLLKPAPLDDKMRGEADELTGMIKDNLQKVVQHGKRANSIVKNMLLHSREGSREHRPADINSLLDESLNLAYHGARAEKGEFNITLQRDFDADAGTIELFPQEITRAFLNLIANGVYAATKRKTEDKEPGFEPTLLATTKNLGTSVEIRIRDNGTGIPAEVKEKMFNPFFTTKPAGEGTGLGLSMTHDIIVKQHGGKIDVATEPGQFTEFTIVLPRNLSGRDRGET